MTTETLILEPVRKQIDEWLKKYPPEHKRSAVLMALRLVQEQNGGWLTEELMNAVADYLQLPNIAVYEVATFYSMYDLQPVGRHKIKVCTTLPCMLCGSENIIEHLEKRLGIKMGETTADGRYTLYPVECLAACIKAPVMQIDDREYHEQLTPEKVDEILDAIDRKEMSP